MARLGSAGVVTATGLDQADVLAIRQAVARLPRRQRTALILRYYAGLDASEIAQVMNCTAATARSLNRHALTALRLDWDDADD